MSKLFSETVETSLFKHHRSVWIQNPQVLSTESVKQCLFYASWEVSGLFVQLQFVPYSISQYCTFPPSSAEWCSFPLAIDGFEYPKSLIIQQKSFIDRFANEYFILNQLTGYHIWSLLITFGFEIVWWISNTANWAKPQGDGTINWTLWKTLFSF